MSLFLFIISIIPIFIILIGVFITYLFENNRYRKALTFELILMALLINTILLIYYVLNNIILRLFYLNFESGTLFLIELIFFSGLIVSIFSKDEIELTINENVHDSLILIIILGICCYTLSLNIILISFWLVFILVFMGMIFFYSDYYKSLNLLKYYIIGVCATILLMFLSCLFIYMESNTLIITEISNYDNFFTYLFLLLGMGIPSGFFPFFIFHLKKFFKECSYTNLLLYLLFSAINCFQIVKILTIYQFNFLISSIISIILAFTGILISFIYIFKELFGKFDGATFSIKKLFGFLICADFNVIILIISIIPVLKYFGILQDYYNTIIFFLIINFLNRLLLYYSFYPIMKETTDDNLKHLGDFWIKYRTFGIQFLLIGFFTSFFYSFTLLNSHWIILFSEYAGNNSFFFNIIAIILVILIINILINLIFISISFILIYFGNRPEFLQRESVNELKITYYFPLILILSCLVILYLLYMLEHNFFYNLFYNYFF